MIVTADALTVDGFGQFLADRRILDRGALDRARRAADASAERLDRVLVTLGLMRELDLRQALAGYFGVSMIGPDELPTNVIAQHDLPIEFLRSRRVLPVLATEKQIVLAVVDPFDPEPAKMVEFWTGRSVSWRIVSREHFDNAFAQLYQTESRATENSIDEGYLELNETDAQRLRDMASEAPVIRFVNALIADGVRANASDIHLESTTDGARVRLRIDGELQDGPAVPQGQWAAIVSRIKIMAKLDIAERRLPQDGRVRSAIGGIDVDFRISTLPTAHGENVVLRILDRSRVELDLGKLGLGGDLVSGLLELIERPNGIVLVTGPTGSGKTTTLYAALERLNRPNAKLFTVEDPIEYQMSGVSQVQVQPAIGLDFPRCLRAILRQNPNVIMIGEIRDLETARIAVQASLTGHLVFSTLHTNSAASAITRLVDMGVERFLLASTLNGILAQRLVRRLCQHCSAPEPLSNAWRAQIATIAPEFECHVTELRVPVGCSQCRQRGFIGRVAIAELLTVDANVRSLVLAGASESALELQARSGGMHSLFHDGVAKATAGLTTLSEVFRVARAS